MKLLKECIPYVVIIAIVLLIRAFVITPVRVNGTSMDPTLKHNEVLLLKKYDHNYSRFKIVVLDYHGEKLVKRIVGLPGEHIKYEGNELYVNGEVVEEDFIDTTTKDFDLTMLGMKTIPEGYYFVMGDNRGNSTDSRVIGLVSEEDIIGVTNFALFPLNKFGTIK